MSNVSKILKIELFFLFLLTIVSFFAFYYQDVLPDNYFTISSEATDINFLSYYLITGVAFVGYYMGPWVFVPFFVFALFYTFQFSKREMFFDTLNFLSLTLGSLCVVYFFAPEFVGLGVRHLLRQNFNPTLILGTGALFLAGFFAGSFRNAFKEATINFFVFLGHLPGHVWHGMKYLHPRRVIGGYQAFRERWSNSFNLELPSFLKGDTPKIGESFKGIKEKVRLPKREEKFEEPTFTPKISADEEENEETEFTPAPKDPALLEAPEGTEFPEATEEAREPKRVRVPGTPRLRTTASTGNEKQYFDIVTTLGEGRKPAKNKSMSSDDAYFADIIDKIELKMAEFRIEARIVNVMKGPVVDTFELELGPGIKVSKIQQLDKDISLALAGAPVRIVYPMIGKTTLGIEVPRNPRDFIFLDEVLESKEFRNNKFRLPVAMGKNAFGQDFVVDLAAMPHMLVAGATGAGKSVFINSLLVSLLVKKSPSQMKLILIDPKKLELAPYKKLPHLVMPVVTDAKTAAISLLWAVQEMERRYSILQDMGVRNIEGFNEKLKTATPDMLARIHQHYENESEDHYELPYLVVVVDEFADLILNKAGKEIEENICRLAQKARASGIHLVLATQRPSVDVVTGLIKANFPTRLAFKVSSSQDSRTILNTVGAEKLLGKGDMLYSNGTTSIRGHSSFVEEKEVEALTMKLEEMGQTFHEGAMTFLENGGPEEVDPYAFGSQISNSVISSGNSEDELYKDAVRIVVEHRTASASMLQRRLKIGYNRAANLVEQMEANGVVGPAEGSKRRKVLISSEEI